MQSMQSGCDSEIFYRCTMTVKEHSATVICKNKREGKQKGAQALLKVFSQEYLKLKFILNCFYIFIGVTPSY